MRIRRLAISALLSLVASTGLADEPPPAASGTMDFGRDVRPILAKSCYSCHGPKSQKSGLRLDRKAEALEGGDGGPAIVAGKADESPLYRYVAGLEPDHRMPPPRSKGPKPSREEIGRLRAWIDQGAAWPDEAAAGADSTGGHWAFKTPVRPAVPEVRDRDWPRNAIDAFVLARLEKEGLKPSPEADKITLARRLSLDLIGLPPTIEEVDAFVSDTRPDAYERLVDRLLASPHYGERWARRWLDRARYADTNGYEKDRERSIWPYRDWVIRALNEDKPFDRFTVEQLAGDLLPDATPDQVVATGFHRNTMTNEEGGIDVEEFRYAALVDRVATTGATWLGLTIQCAQCHTHKYDPITQREYYEFLAFFNNADEPEAFDVPDPAVAAKRGDIGTRVKALEDDLENQFPATDPGAGWEPIAPISAASTSGAVLSIRPDGAIVASGPSPDRATYTIVADLKDGDLDAIRLEALTDPASLAFGPGRTPHGNFVLTGVSATLEPAGAEGAARPLPFATATADASQPGFDPKASLDADPNTGWAIDDGSGRLDKTRSAVFEIERGFRAEGTNRLRVTLDQQYGGSHTLGRFRLSVRRKPKDIAPDASIAELRRAHLAARMAAWEESIAPHRWSVLTPSRVVSKKHATMTVRADGSVLVTGDKPNNDVYEVELPAPESRITAIRLETLPDPSLPDGGPGRAPLFSVGDFILTELNLSASSADNPKASTPIPLKNASQDHAEPGHTAAQAIDGVPESGWTIKGGIGRPQSAVFELAEPLTVGPKGTRLTLTLHQFGIHQMTIGKFRVSVTGDAAPVRASGLPAEIEAALLVPEPERKQSQNEKLNRHFLSIAPETAPARANIEALRRSMPRFSTTLVMRERDPKHARTTHIHRRGEFLSLGDAVTPGVPAVLPGLKESGNKTRLDLARWLVSGDHPLVARVAVNGMWQAFFGRGIVATPEDFGTRGEPPTHPDLLDWLALEFPSRGWSQKAMHRLIVTSATYRQSSRATPDAIARDPKNLLLARGARFRVEAETIRDIALRASGLFNPKVGGPSVYPPQPDGVTNLAYGQMSWPTSAGADRYRRGLYTYSKRAAPYAAFSLMDAPSPDTACVRRERSNTPLQALTLLNDPVFFEASRVLAMRTLAEAATTEGREVRLFRLCVSRSPSAEELAMLTAFYQQQLTRFRSGTADAGKVAGPELRGIDRDEVAAWVLIARSVLNLDETITRE